MIVEIFELGRERKRLSIEIPTTKGTSPNDIAEELVNAAATSGALRSTEISATWDTKSGTGTIYAGFHSVGKAQIDNGKAGRGGLTLEIQKVAKERLGREISLQELRLMPYVDSVMKNNRKIDRSKVNQEEEDILEVWEGKGWIQEADRLMRSRDFYNAIQEILWFGYVNYD